MKKIYLFTFIAVLFGLVIGLGSFTFIYGKGYSYLLDDPKSCMNCHIMRDQYESWNRSSHHAVTTCNSCHAPDNLAYKYVNKMDNGFWHGLKFTTGKYHDPIQIRPKNFDIAMHSCMKCHSNIINTTIHKDPLESGRSCVQCHRDVGHAH